MSRTGSCALLQHGADVRVFVLILEHDVPPGHLILLDAPCSGLGTVRRDPDIKWRREPEDLARFASEQRRLLRQSADFVTRGGVLIYATCSSEPEENDDVIGGFLAARTDFTLEHRHQTLPFRDGLEAFFGAVLRRAV